MKDSNPFLLAFKGEHSNCPTVISAMSSEVERCSVAPPFTKSHTLVNITPTTIAHDTNNIL